MLNCLSRIEAGTVPLPGTGEVGPKPVPFIGVGGKTSLIIISLKSTIGSIANKSFMSWIPTIANAFLKGPFSTAGTCGCSLSTSDSTCSSAVAGFVDFVSILKSISFLLSTGVLSVRARRFCVCIRLLKSYLSFYFLFVSVISFVHAEPKILDPSRIVVFSTRSCSSNNM